MAILQGAEICFAVDSLENQAGNSLGKITSGLLIAAMIILVA